MDKSIARKIIGVRFILTVFVLGLLGAGLTQLFTASRVFADTGTGVWVDQSHIYYKEKQQLFTKTKTITNGGASVMFLSSNGACNTHTDDMNIGGSNGGNYQTSKTAFIDQLDSSCQGNGTPIYLTMLNTYNDIGAGSSQGSQGYAEWISDTSLKDLGTGFVYNSTGINGNTMTLTYYDAGVNKVCDPNSMLVGDNTNSYMATNVATLTVNVQTTPNGVQPNCAQNVSHLTIVNQHTSSSVTGQWQGTDPYGQIDITNVPDQYSALRGSGALTTSTVFVEPSCAGSCSGFKSPINGNDMLLNADKNNCKQTVSYMHVNPYQSSLTGTLTTWGPAQNSRAPGSSCIQYTITVDLTLPYGGGTTQPPTNGGNPVTATDNCNVPTQNEPLRWIECPVISSLQTVTTAMNGIISSLLEVSPAEFFNAGVQNAFNLFRNIGVALLVIAGLVMVVSQAADLEIFAAHTVRKALPRIIIAAILIALSWPLLQFVIIFFNDMGAWTGKIILSVANALPGGNGGGEVGNALANYGDELILGVIAAGAVIFLGAGGIISLLISFLLLVLVGVVVLMIRQIIVLICVLMTPLALASYVLPGTEKLGRFWKDTFLAALIMFPLIEAFLASGAALAYIIMNVQSGNYFYHILAIVIYIAPYFAVPFAFKLAGGLVGRVAEFAQGTHHKTIESRLQGYRQNTAAKNTQALKAGSRWNPNSRWTTALGGQGVNFLGRHIGAGMRGRFGIGAVGSAAMANNMALSADAASKMDSNFAAQMNNEEAMAAVSFGNDRAALSKLSYFNAAALATGTTSRAELERIVQQRATAGGGPSLTGAALDRAINVEAESTATGRLGRALAAGRTIQATQQMQTAAADALVRSGKVIENRNEFDALVDSISHGNATLAGGQRGALQYTARQIGREDYGRNDDYEALKEMDMATVARQKPKSLENLFGGNQIITAVKNARSREEQQHFVDVLYAAHQNQSLSPEQQRQVSQAVATVTSDKTYGASGMDLWSVAKTNYTSKISPSDRRVKQHIKHIHTLDNGIKLYSFQYIWGGPTYVGVMAQDLLHTHPEAVVVDSNGYYGVRYDILGLKMMLAADWVVQKHHEIPHKSLT